MNYYYKRFTAPWTVFGTIQIRWYQKGKTRKVKPIWIYWSKRQWVAVASAGPYANLHLAPDRITTPASHHSVFTGRMPFLPRNQQRQSIEGNLYAQYNTIPYENSIKLCLWHRSSDTVIQSHSRAALCYYLLLSIVIRLSVCMSVYLSACISQKPCPNFVKFSVHVRYLDAAQSSSDNNRIRFLTSALWMTSCLCIMGAYTYIRHFGRDLISFARGRQQFIYSPSTVHEPLLLLFLLCAWGKVCYHLLTAMLF